MSNCSKCTFPVTGQGIQIADKTFHASCFLCYRCNGNLANSSIHDVNGNLHCKSCVDQLRQQQGQPQAQAPQQPPQAQAAAPAPAPQQGQACDGCTQKLSGNVVSVLGKTYHATCFRCARCCQPLEGSFGEVNGKPHCPACVTALRQQQQQQAQQAHNQAQAQAQAQHTAQQQAQQQQQQQQAQPQAQPQAQTPTVLCAHCEQGIIGGYCEFQGKPFCESCADKLQRGVIQPKGGAAPAGAAKCAGCNGVLFGGIKKAMGVEWHTLCFVCTTCKQPLPGDFKEHKGKPYCDEHYGQFAEFFCAKCNGPIRAGEFVDEGALKFHLGYFHCTTCHKDLKAEGKFVPVGSDYYCGDCFLKR
eukprot:TRINITY_DN1821_c0_g1_i1.p1 TRINITY_DN1821_c0_g1~~TRINITY_DN1821_c0_g1_i1.p1  ORF type:complete len:358 (+),score=139.38 TRINITY_DN1821_c0_g1_i1:32-1105(+)